MINEDPTLGELNRNIDAVRRDMDGVRRDVREDLGGFRQEVREDLGEFRQALNQLVSREVYQVEMGALRDRLTRAEQEIADLRVERATDHKTTRNANRTAILAAASSVVVLLLGVLIQLATKPK